MKVVIAGATGRMGRMLVEAVTAAPDLSLSGALDMPSSPGIGTDPAAFLGRKPVQQALDDAVSRGNEALRRYEQLNAGKK